MCGRIDQNDNPRIYLNSIGWTDAAIDSQAIARANVPPGTYVPVLHMQDGQRRVDDTFWSYWPAWAAAATPAPGKKHIPIAINVKVEKLMGAYWKPLLRTGRSIVCASGWYEWKGEKGNKQPWHIHLKDSEPLFDPLFLLALARSGPFKENREESGFVLVTADSIGGMVDIHNRRPVAVSADGARRWMDVELPPDQAVYLAQTHMLDAEIFEWNPVNL